jgi:hypothetical protein
MHLRLRGSGGASLGEALQHYLQVTANPRQNRDPNNPVGFFAHPNKKDKMKKIPCLFQRTFDGPHKSSLTDGVTPSCEWVLNGEGVASRKWDGTACAVIDGKLYKRYDAKAGKPAPVDGIPCQEPDPVTGHWPHWIRVDPLDNSNKYIVEAWSFGEPFVDGTYEAVGPRINGNPEGFARHVLRQHGDTVLDVPRTKEGIHEFLIKNRFEGIVFTHLDGRMCKIRRADFGLPWGSK